MVNLIVSAYAPFETLSLNVHDQATVSQLRYALRHICPESEQVLSAAGGRPLRCVDALGSLSQGQDVFLRLTPRMSGGKGGFASQLRAQGGRMSHNRNTNKSSCRDLSGRRLSTIKEAERLSQYLSEQPDREKAAKEAAEEKLRKLKEEIARLDEELKEGTAGKKRRIEDTKYVEESKEIVNDVKDAVRAALLKKRRLARKKTGGKESSPSDSKSETSQEATLDGKTSKQNSPKEESLSSASSNNQEVSPEERETSAVTSPEGSETKDEA